MALPTDLANDLTNPADEIPDTAYTAEADPAFDEDPLTDAVGATPAAEKKSLNWAGILSIVFGILLVGIGAKLNVDTPTSLHPVLIVGFVVLIVGVILFFVL